MRIPVLVKKPKATSAEVTAYDAVQGTEVMGKKFSTNWQRTLGISLSCTTSGGSKLVVPVLTTLYVYFTISPTAE